VTVRRTGGSVGDGLAHEGGYTLSEVLIAIVILTTAVAVMIGAISSSILASRVHRETVTADAVVRRYAEQLVATAYVPNATTASYPAIATPTAGYTASILAVECWDGTSYSPATFPGPCAVGAVGDHGVQRLTIEARATNGPGRQQLQVVKRKP
jgi:type II secretory pathway pseudopilin PulG